MKISQRLAVIFTATFFCLSALAEEDKQSPKIIDEENYKIAADQKMYWKVRIAAAQKLQEDDLVILRAFLLDHLTGIENNSTKNLMVLGEIGDEKTLKELKKYDAKYPDRPDKVNAELITAIEKIEKRLRKEKMT